MKTNWDLTVFYKDYDDPQYAADMKALPEQVKALAALIEQPDENAVRKVRAIVDAMEALSVLSERVGLMNMLTISVDADHPQANAAQTPMNRVHMAYAQCESSFARYLSSLSNLDEIIAADPELEKRAFVLREYAENARHQID